MRTLSKLADQQERDAKRARQLAQMDDSYPRPTPPADERLTRQRINELRIMLVDVADQGLTRTVNDAITKAFNEIYHAYGL